MFVFDKENHPQPVDRTYPGTDVVLRIKHIDRDRMAELKRQANGDQFLMDKLILREAVMDWPAGIVDPAGEKLPCTDDLKDAVFNRFSQLAVWVTVQAGSAAELEAQKFGDRLKNLSGGHDGKSTSPTASAVVPPVS